MKAWLRCSYKRESGEEKKLTVFPVQPHKQEHESQTKIIKRYLFFRSTKKTYIQKVFWILQRDKRMEERKNPQMKRLDYKYWSCVKRKNIFVTYVFTHFTEQTFLFCRKKFQAVGCQQSVGEKSKNFAVDYSSLFLQEKKISEKLLWFCEYSQL